MQKFEISAQWSGGRVGHGCVWSANLQLPLSRSDEVRGVTPAANPEELLLAAVEPEIDFAQE